MPNPSVTGDPLLEACGATSGVVCMVGGGGKKTSMYALAARHPGAVAITATVHIPPFPDLPGGVTLSADAALLAPQVEQAARAHRLVAYACPSSKPGRFAGVPAELVAAVHARAGFDLTLVKADGARRRWIKAPAAHEPCIAPGTDTVLAVASVQVIGQPLDERSCHHPELAAAITGLPVGQPLQARHLARLLTHADGGMRGTGDCEVIPLLNMVDDQHWEALAREVADRVLACEARVQQVVLARMHSAAALVDVVRRQP